MTKRQQRRALAQWECDTRQWAHQTARDLVLAMVSGQPAAVTPYRIGVVLDPGEQVWAECPVQFLEEPIPADGEVARPVRTWLVTSERIVGRLGDDCLYGWRWEHTRGCRVDVSDSAEFVSLDRGDGSHLEWAGAGVAPLAVAAVFRLHGYNALLDHPGLAAIRVGDSSTSQRRPGPAALPPWHPKSTLWWT